MNRSLSLVLAGLLTLGPALLAQAGEGWHTQLEAAKKEAKAKKRPLLLEFTGSDWCRPCMLLERQVFAGKPFKEWSKRLVLVRLDFPSKTKLPEALKKQNEALKERYKVEGFPTVLLIDYEGAELARKSGYSAREKETWVKALSAEVAQSFDAKSGKKQAVAPFRWETSYAKALARSKAEKKPILANFTGSDWCHWCTRLKVEVFDTPAFKAWARKRVVLLELDYPSQTPQAAELKKQNKELAAKYGIEGFPTVLFLDAEGKSVGTSGYLPGGPKTWIENAEQVLSKAPKK